MGGITPRVDIIERGGRRWVEVKAGPPPSPGSAAEANLLEQVQDMLDVAADPRFHVGGSPPEIAVSFGSGEVSPSLKSTLDRLQVKIEIRSQGVLP